MILCTLIQTDTSSFMLSTPSAVCTVHKYWTIYMGGVGAVIGNAEEYCTVQLHAWCCLGSELYNLLLRQHICYLSWTVMLLGIMGYISLPGQAGCTQPILMCKMTSPKEGYNFTRPLDLGLHMNTFHASWSLHATQDYIRRRQLIMWHCGFN